MSTEHSSEPVSETTNTNAELRAGQIRRGSREADLVEMQAVVRFLGAFSPMELPGYSGGGRPATYSPRMIVAYSLWRFVHDGSASHLDAELRQPALWQALRDEIEAHWPDERAPAEPPQWEQFRYYRRSHFSTFDDLKMLETYLMASGLSLARSLGLLDPTIPPDWFSPSVLNVMQVDGSWLKPLSTARWEYRKKADGTGIEVLLRSRAISAETARVAPELDHTVKNDRKYEGRNIISACVRGNEVSTRVVLKAEMVPTGVGEITVAIPMIEQAARAIGPGLHVIAYDAVGPFPLRQVAAHRRRRSPGIDRHLHPLVRRVRPGAWAARPKRPGIAHASRPVPHHLRRRHRRAIPLQGHPDRRTHGPRHRPHHPRARRPPHRRDPHAVVRQDRDAATHHGHTGPVYGNNFVAICTRGDAPGERIVLSVGHTPRPGREADTAVEIIKDVWHYAGNGVQAVVYDGALHGVHIEDLMTNCGVVVINKIAAAPTTDDEKLAGVKAAKWLPLGVYTHPVGRRACRHTLAVEDGAVVETDLDDNGDVVIISRPRRRQVRRTQHADSTYRMTLAVEVACKHGPFLVYLNPHAHAGDGNYRRPENLRLLPRADDDFKKLYGRRNDSESFNSCYKRTLLINRATSLGWRRQLFDILSYGVLNNANAWDS